MKIADLVLACRLVEERETMLDVLSGKVSSVVFYLETPGRCDNRPVGFATINTMEALRIALRHRKEQIETELRKLGVTL